MSRVQQSEECLQSIRNAEVREWLATTFTNSEAMSEPRYRLKTPLMMFKAAAHSIIIGNFMKRLVCESLVDIVLYWK